MPPNIVFHEPNLKQLVEEDLPQEPDGDFLSVLLLCNTREYQRIVPKNDLAVSNLAESGYREVSKEAVHGLEGYGKVIPGTIQSSLNVAPNILSHPARDRTTLSVRVVHQLEAGSLESK